jgi:hypothetical protein
MGRAKRGIRHINRHKKPQVEPHKAGLRPELQPPHAKRQVRICTGRVPVLLVRKQLPRKGEVKKFLRAFNFAALTM